MEEDQLAHLEVGEVVGITDHEPLLGVGLDGNPQRTRGWSSGS
jgi:hypothetical protein